MRHIPLRLLLFALIAQLIFSCFPILLYAQTSVPTPSVPEFTINLTDIKGNDKFEIILVIKNQWHPEKINGYYTDFSFNARAKGHFSEDWNQAPWVSLSGNLDESGYAQMVIPSEQYPAGGLVDFQVEAILTGNGGTSASDWVAQHSGWSSTQTVTIPSTTFPTSNSPSATPIADPFGHSTQTTTNNPQPDNGDHWNQMSIVITIIAMIVVVDGLALSVFFVKKRHKKIRRKS